MTGNACHPDSYRDHKTQLREDGHVGHLSRAPSSEAGDSPTKLVPINVL